MNRLTALLTGAWLGMQIMAAYAAGILFERIDRQAAGDIAGVLFATVNYCGLAVWLLAWFAAKNRRAHGFSQCVPLGLGQRVLQFLRHPVGLGNLGSEGGAQSGALRRSDRDD